MTQCARPRFSFGALYREIYDHCRVPPTDHIKALSDYVLIAEYLVPKQETNLNRPIIRHPDLQPNNLFVSDSMDMLGVIDWQHCSIQPLFLLQAGPPKYFHNDGDAESERVVERRLPENFAQLGAQEQDAAKELHRRRQLHFFYIGLTAKLNEDHFDACSLAHVVLRQQPYQHAGTPWEGDNATLKSDLIRATHQWSELTSTEAGAGAGQACPLTYSAAEVDRCLALNAKQNEADASIHDARRRLGINTEGWVSVEGYAGASCSARGPKRTRSRPQRRTRRERQSATTGRLTIMTKMADFAERTATYPRTYVRTQKYKFTAEIGETTRTARASGMRKEGTCRKVRNWV